MHSDEKSRTRREFLRAASFGAGLSLSACATGKLDRRRDGGGGGEGGEEVLPNEDLMREHGVLDRILLVYEEGLRRMEAKEDLAPEVLVGGADIVRRFIEEYHEKLEEDHLFPRFEKAGKLVDLVATLRTQHRAGRALTETVERMSSPEGVRDESSRRRLAESLRLFVRLYRPHAAREDTELFPAFRSVVSRSEYEALGEEFEGKEHELFGEDGFERIVEEVAGLERAFGIHDLARFTPA